jgi:hypothetical protein
MKLPAFPPRRDGVLKIAPQQAAGNALAIAVQAKATQTLKVVAKVAGI